MSKRGIHDVFELVHSMSPSEKRHFRIQQHRSGRTEQMKYMRLFEVLNGMDVYDREAVLVCIPEIKPEQLPNLKSRLYRALLQNLTEVQSNDPRSRVFLGHCAGHLEVLYSKGLFEQCLKKAHHIKKLMYEREHYEMLPEILMWEQKAYGRLLVDTEELERHYTRVTEELEYVSEILTRLATVNVMRHRIFSLFTHQGRVVRDETRAQKIREIARESEEILGNIWTFKEERTIRHMLLQAYMMLADREHLLNHCRKLDALFSEAPSHRQAHLTEYIQFLNAYTIALNMFGHYEEALHITERTKDIQAGQEFALTSPQEALVFDSYAFHQLEAYIRMGWFEEGVELIPELEEGLARYQPHMNPVNIHSKYYRIALVLFGAGRYRESLLWVNRILNSPQFFRKDIQAGVRLLNLILHFELHNLSLVEYAVKSTYRYLKRRQSLYRTESLLLRFLRKLHEIQDKKTLREEFQNLADDIAELFEEDQLEHYAIPYFDVIAWLKSKVTGRSLSESVKNKRWEEHSVLSPEPTVLQ